MINNAIKQCKMLYQTRGVRGNLAKFRRIYDSNEFFSPKEKIMKKTIPYQNPSSIDSNIIPNFPASKYQFKIIKVDGVCPVSALPGNKYLFI